MNLKKTLAAGAASALLLGLLVVPASAHGGHHHGGGASTSYAVCTVDGCTETGRHDHDGVTYCGYDHAGGTCTGSACSHVTGHRGGCHR